MALRRNVLAGTAFGLLAGMGSSLVAYHFLEHTSQKVSSICATDDRSFITTADLRGFTQSVDQRYLHPPGFWRNPSIPFVRTFAQARLKGYISNLALTGPFRSEEDAYAKSLGYKVGNLPLVPLHGAIVARTSGVLEVYQTNWEFTSVDGARSWFDNLRNPPQETGQPQRQVLPFAGGDGAYVFVSSMGPDDGRNERLVGVDVLEGPTVIEMNVQGGATMPAQDGLDLGKKAFARLTSVCSGGTGR